MRHLTWFPTALVDHGDDLDIFQCLWSIFPVKGNEADPAGIIEDTADMKFQSISFDCLGRCFCEIMPALPINERVQELLLTSSLDEQFCQLVPELYFLSRPEPVLIGWNVPFRHRISSKSKCSISISFRELI